MAHPNIEGRFIVFNFMLDLLPVNLPTCDDDYYHVCDLNYLKVAYTGQQQRY